MVSKAAINRLIATSADFDLTGLQIIGYYLRLYAIKVILGDEVSTAEFMDQLSELMRTVEDYKSSVESAEGSQAESSVYTLIRDQEKAKTYILNFAMSLYNGKLKQIQSGPWDYTLQRGLWCCIDLFSCILNLWEDGDGSLQRRIKYCKVYLTKLAKGEMGDTANQDAPAGGLAPVADSPVQEPEDGSSDDEISAMLRRLRTAEKDGSDNGEGTSTADISLPEAPGTRPGRGDRNDEPAIGEEPKFIDSEAEEEKVPDVVPEKQRKEAASENRRFTQDQLRSMMEKSTQIEKAQKMAKYAISALNYDDIPTARDELLNALEILNALQ
ncbi:hypothetical protein HG536_0B00770 [Torulaspora globosa]|uniref:Vta1 C-terminal domain-containing protein n=1 Tax=Torulaspora globosa TaxID=48254 RepID=A0A7G3ZCI0_9SACH|nr:uncharacterized protein HG536_0B00770 [Torulaspora globosa]QLL31216.1 hypothetical protein HG536_0B00770 [Torulaspora globosa]